MYLLKDSFHTHDANKQPYSFAVERHTETANLHAWVQEDGFHLASVGNRHILNTPAFTHGTLEMTFGFNCMEEIRPGFILMFQYDEASRKGLGVRFDYDLTSAFEIALVEVNGLFLTAKAKTVAQLSEPLQEQLYPFSMTIGDAGVSGSIAGVPFAFDCPAARGKLALERREYIGEMIIGEIRFATEDEFAAETLIPEQKVEIPLVNGGDMPYTVSWRVDKIEGDCYLTAALDGGTRTRPVNREDRPGQYVAEKDWMTSPYLILENSAYKERYNIAVGETCFIDPNIYWDCQKALFGDTELPLTGTYRIPECLIAPDTEVLFGYEALFCSGYASQSGGCEFRFTTDGTLLSYGPARDGGDIYEIRSQEDKLALSFIPEDLYQREDVLAHIRNNHYFDVSEEPRFTLDMRTLTDPSYLEVRAEILDVYESRVLHTPETEITVTEEKDGYHLIQCAITAPKMELGVWKVAFRITYGGRPYHSAVKTFEVFDKDSEQNPALAVGLPFVFSMPNEQKRLMRNSFDLWNPAKSCDVEHYITCITDTPVEAETRQSWRVTKPFKREWFAWLTSRTCTDWQLENHLDTVKNADYLFASWQEKFMDMGPSGLYPLRQDHFNYNCIMNRAPARLPILDDFLKDRPEIAAKLTYQPGSGEFSKEDYIRLMTEHGPEWVAYQNRRGLEIIREYNQELSQLNPNHKRSLYGPINVYVTPTLSAHSTNVFGFSDRKAMAEEVFNGFCVFEDYPYSCSYQTYRGAFTVMTLLLDAPMLRLYPEQYKGSRGGCIDGAVKFAHAPMGAYTLEAYQNSTHAFEYVFNTAYRLPDGFHYWNTYGFHRSDYTDAFMNRLVLDWRHVVEKKPAKPLRSTAFLAEYSDRDDEFVVLDNGFCVNNPAEMGHGLLFECTREAGIPNGFALKYESLASLSADECDVLILPNLAHAAPEAVAQIRRLYEEGVNLIAVSRVDGLEDLFGVALDERTVKLNTLRYGREKEYVKESEAALFYKASSAHTVMHSEAGDVLALGTERTLLLNTSVAHLGSEDSGSVGVSKSPHIVGELVRRMLKEELIRLSSPLAHGENAGVTLFETAKGGTALLAIDYTPFDNRAHGVKQAVIKLNLPGVTGVQCDKPVFVGKKDGIVREVRFDMLPHESVFLDLQKG